ncbi:helix-turn-helix transcriptional regulator [Catellatospora sp. NPDC049609]|uniref:helix-turn-helix domain-containing protein n=1 Tax=Catellatospora sp. NPDC049609 TaxID=3155505 RepID=UPI00342B17B5
MRHLFNRPLWDELMKAKGITGLREQARQAEVPPSTLSRLLEGETEAQLGTAISLAKFAGVAVELLFPATSQSKSA